MQEPLSCKRMELCGGTENLYKMYAESYAGEEGLAHIMKDGKALIESLVETKA